MAKQKYLNNLIDRLLRILLWVGFWLVIPAAAVVLAAWGLIRLGLPHWLSMATGAVCGRFNPIVLTPSRTPRPA